MDQDPILESLLESERRVLAQLRSVPEYKLLESIRAQIREWRETQNKATGRVNSARDGTVAAAVQEAAAEFLRARGRRAQTPVIAEEIRRRGIRAGNPDNIINTVSSYLSSARDIFDNVRGEGYGLVEWSRNETHTSPAIP